MKQVLFSLLKTVAAPLHGKGIIDKHAPFLLKIFQFLYVRLQKQEVREVAIPLNARLKVLSNDTGIGLPLIIKGSYEPLETSLFLSSINEGDTIVDIGANVGYYTVLASKKAGKKGNVIAFEVDQQTLTLLRENLSINHCTNVELIEEAIADKSGLLSFTSERINKGESSLSSNTSHASYQVKATTFDNFLKQKKVKRINILKIDIEGAEIMAFKAAQSLSSLHNIKLFIEYNPTSLKKYGDNPETLLKQVEMLGFKLVTIIDESRNATHPYSFKKLTEILSHTTYCNIYCEKD